MPLRATLLGSGSSGGVPRVGGDWGACDPLEPKNRRSRCSLWVEYWEGDRVPPVKERTSILIDTSPDLREQILSVGAKRVDAVFFTHEHADQCHGIDDLRGLAYRMRARIPCYMDADTKPHIMQKFGYCFEMPEGRVHPPILELMPDLNTNTTVEIDGPGGVMRIETLSLSHGVSPSSGFLINGQLAYTPDVHEISDDQLSRLEDVPVWIADALRYASHPTHAHSDRVLTWLARTRAKDIVLTNLHIDMDYATLSAELPKRLRVGYDGMEITV